MSRLENSDGFYSNQKSNKITIRIQPDREEEWENYRKSNNFDSMSSFIRTAVNGYIINEKEKKGESGLIHTLKGEVMKMDNKIQELLDEQKTIVKIIASEIEVPINAIYQKGIVINLLNERPRDLDELNKILDDLSEHELISIINEYLEASIIDINENNKYYVIK